jgi:N-acetylmuramoyl-L-alanine amidase
MQRDDDRHRPRAGSRFHRTPRVWASVLFSVALLVTSCSSGNGSTASSTTTSDPTDPAPTQPNDTTTAPEPTTTAPTTTTASALATRGTRVVMSPSGVILPVVGTAPGGLKVLTPCGRDAILSDGKPVGPAQVVIDPGHGGPDTGTVAANGVSEKALNLAVAQKAVDDLSALGITAVLTRTKDYYVSLATRSAIANALSPDAFLSIHHNGGAAAARTSPGSQVFYKHESAAAKRMAGLVYEEVTRALSTYQIAWQGPRYAGAVYRLGKDGQDFYGVIRNTTAPAALVEVAYLSNKPEAALMATDSFRVTEAKAIATGVQRFLTTSDPGSGFQAPITGDNEGSSGVLQSCTDPPLR